jgi:hypothetical protein
MTLLLSATKPSTKAGTDAEIEKITKTVHVRPCLFLRRGYPRDSRKGRRCDAEAAYIP